ncbi:MAG: xylulokinase [Ruminococcaceae bacterium]|nr:xylulokinase [Oscillospiraceae bacterium]
MNYYIGADLGTSSLKLLLTDEKGGIIASVTKEYPVAYPHPGWSEQSPEDWWDALQSGIRELTKKADKSRIRAIGVAGQMHGLVILDQEDKVIRPAILWNDGRTAGETQYLNEQIGKKTLSDYTANIAFAGFTAPKILWLYNQERENFDAISKLMLPKDFINYRLTGVHATDYSDASGMLLLDVKRKCWSKEMLDICHIKESQMPKLFESYQSIGTLLPKVASELGLPEDTVVCAGAGDNAGAAIGTGTVGKGKCNISLGTSGTVFISSDRFGVDQHNALHSFCHADGGYHLMGCILSAASCNKWFCDEVLQTKEYEKEQQAIKEEHLGNNTLFFLPYLMGERSPHNDTAASGTFVGLRPDTDRSQMLLAVLEGVAFAIRDNIEVAKRLGISITVSTVCGGGAKSPLWMTILANVLNLTLQLPKTEEGPGFGAARLAMVARGDVSSLADCIQTEIKQEITPDPALAKRYEERYQQFVKIYPALKQVYAQLQGGNENDI